MVNAKVEDIFLIIDILNNEPKEVETMKTAKICTYGLALTLATITVAGCGKSGGGGNDTPQAITKQTEEKYPVSGILKETDGFAMPGTISFIATDVNGNAVKLYSDKTGGTEVTSIKASDDGIVNFFVDSAALLPVTIKASGSTDVPNHIANSTMFTIDKTGATSFTINIVDLDIPSQGVLPLKENGILGDLDDFLVTPFNMQLASTQVTIPSGTAFQNGAGSNLKGAVKASLTAFASSTATTPIIDPVVFDTTIYDPQLEGGTAAVLKQSDLENFPGGLNNTHAKPGDGYFVTAGFVAVNVTDANGIHAKKLANGTFTIRMNIPAGTVNPNTDVPLVAGDTIPIFTYDETNLVWKPEVDASSTPVLETVLKDTVTNELYVLHTTNHFSFWNLGWLVKTLGTNCTATLNLKNDAMLLPLNLKATFTSGNKGKNFLLTGFKPANDATITASNVPNQNLDIVLTDALNNVVWSQKSVNWCAATPLTASYVAPASKQAVAVTVNVTEFCSQDPTKTQVVPSTLTTVDITVPNPNPNGVPKTAHIPISVGVTNTAGTFVHKLTPTSGPYSFFAFDRRTATFVPATTPTNPVTVVKATPQTISIKIPVTCKPAPTGSTGGNWIF